MNNFPAMTEEQRQQAIKDFTFRAVNTDCDVSLLAYQIAIAALSSAPASREIIQASLYANRPLFTTPPAPVLRLPEEVDTSNLPFAAMAWNACLAEVKRLNIQPSPTEASNEQ